MDRRRLLVSSGMVRKGLLLAVVTALLVILVAGVAQPPHIVAHLQQSGQITQITLNTKDIIYDPFSQKIYASVPSAAGSIGNSITPIDPSTGTIGPSVFVGSEPGKLAISDNGQFLYVSLDGAAAVRQFDLASQTAGLQFSLGSDPFFGPRYVEDIEVLPGNPEAVAVSRWYHGQIPRHAGVAIYDNGVQRPTVTHDHTGSNVIEFSASASKLYGQNIESTEFGFRRMSIDASGVSVQDVTDNLLSEEDIEFDGGLIYGTSGRVVNPETLTLVGTFPASGVVESDSALGRTFFLHQSGATCTLLIFDQSTFELLASLDIPGVSGTASSLIRWGADGLAFRTNSNQVFLVRTQMEWHYAYVPLVLKRFPYHCDNFSDPTTGWYVGDSGNVKYSYVGGEYEILLRKESWMGAVTAPIGGLTDGSIEADVHLHQGTKGAYGLIFGLKDWDHFYLLLVDPGIGYYSLWRAKPDDWVKIVNWTYSSYIFTADAVNHLKVERNGDEIVLRANGHLLKKTSDDKYIGSLGVGLLAASWDEAPIAVRFDNFCAQTSETATLMEGTSLIMEGDTTGGRGPVPPPTP